MIIFLGCFQNIIWVTTPWKRSLYGYVIILENTQKHLLFAYDSFGKYILPYLFSELLLAIFLSCSKYNNICKFYLIKVGKQFQQLLSGCTRSRFSQLSRYMLAVSIWQKYFLLSNTLRNRMKNNLPTAQKISQIVYLALP